MSTFFTVERRFQAPDGDEIQTEGFLRASQGVADFIGLLGLLFKPVKSDVHGNITKLRNIQQTKPAEYLTLNSIVASEVGKPYIEQIGSDALLWLNRALEYLQNFLQFWLNDYNEGKRQEDLSEYFLSAYEVTLKPHHNWITQKLFALCLNGSPGRESLLKLLVEESPQIVSDDTEKIIFKDIEVYLNSLTIITSKIHRIFDKFDFKH